MSREIRLALVLALLAIPSTVLAHQLDEYVQATLVAIEVDDVRLKINLTPGVEVAEQVMALIDHDRDGVISASENAAYGELLKRDLSVRLDGRNIELKLAGSKIPVPSELRTGLGIIQMEFSFVPGSLAAGAHSFTLENRHLPVISAYLFNAAQPTSDSIRITSQKRNENQSAGEIEFGFQSPASSLPASFPKAVGVVASLTALVLALFAGLWRARKRLRRYDTI